MSRGMTYLLIAAVVVILGAIGVGVHHMYFM